MIHLEISLPSLSFLYEFIPKKQSDFIDLYSVVYLFVKCIFPSKFSEMPL